jgi:integrase
VTSPRTIGQKQRQAYGSGSISQRSPDVWRLRVYVGDDPLTGLPLQRERTFRGGEKDARAALAKFVTEAHSGRVARTSTTVGQLLDRWLLHIEGLGRQPSTIHGYKGKIDHDIRPALGSVPLNKLGAETLDRCYAAWTSSGLASATVRQYHAILSAALHQAVKWGWIDRNPADRATPPSPRGQTINPPTPEQVNRLVAAAEAKDPVLATAIALAALTGARRGELAALRWSDIDLTTGYITIARSITVVNGKTDEGGTKTHQIRRLALDELGAQILRNRWAYQVDLSERAGSPLAGNPFVLSYQAHAGIPVNPDTISHRFAALAARLEVTCRFHDLRHFSVTTLIAAGVDIRTVATRHGHAQATMTLNRYAHALPASDREAAAVLGRALGR